MMSHLDMFRSKRLWLILALVAIVFASIASFTAEERAISHNEYASLSSGASSSSSSSPPSPTPTPSHNPNNNNLPPESGSTSKTNDDDDYDDDNTTPLPSPTPTPTPSPSSPSPSPSPTPTPSPASTFFRPSKARCVDTPAGIDPDPLTAPNGQVLPGNGPHRSCELSHILYRDNKFQWLYQPDDEESEDNVPRDPIQHHDGFILSPQPPAVRLNSRRFHTDSYEYEMHLQSVLPQPISIQELQSDSSLAAAHCTVLPDSQSLLLFAKIGYEHVGHWIVDNVLPISWALQKLNLTERSPKALTLVAEDNNIDGHKGDFSNEFYKSISETGVHLHIDSIQKDGICPTGCCMIESFIVGLGGMGWYFSADDIPEKKHGMETLHGLVVNNLPFSQETRITKFLHPGQDPLRIILIQRKNSATGMHRSFCSPQLMVDSMLASFNNTALSKTTVELVSFEGKSLQEQVQDMRSSSIAIGIDGAAMDQVVWMHQNSGVILFSRGAASQPNFEKFNHESYSGPKLVAPWIDLWRARGHDVRTLYSTTYGPGECLNVDIGQLNSEVADVLTKLQAKYMTQKIGQDDDDY